MKNVRHHPENKMSAPKKAMPVFVIGSDRDYLFSFGFRLMKKEKAHRYKIHCFTSSDECLKNLRLNPTLLILDYSFNASNEGEMSSQNLLHKIKAVNPDIPIVILVGPGNSTAIFDTYDIGAYTYIVKDGWALFWIEKIIRNLLSITKPATSS